MDSFIEQIAEIFDVDPSTINMATKFRTDIDDFNSMIGFALLVMMEDEYGVKVSIDDFLACQTIADLYNHCNK